MKPLTGRPAVSLWSVPVLVAALGYFVDIYDLLLFTLVRIDSLRSLGLSEEQIKIVGHDILNYQMIGMLLGGVLWGVLADKKGRLQVLFGSILMYSIANICNGFVHTTFQYGLCRFIAGIGLAGELGAGITLVSELLNKEQRGVATSLVAGVGLTGAVAAYFIKQLFGNNWQICFFIGGALGLLLLLLRISVFESGMYRSIEHSSVRKGNFLMFFTNGTRFRKYILSILIGLPTWYVIGLLIAFSNDFAKALHVQGAVDPARAIMYAYVAISIGDVLTGLVSQGLRSRKKALFIFYGITVVSLVLFYRLDGASANQMYFVCALMGFGTGFWAIFVTMAAEQFGTNLRGTAATTVPNMVRGSLPLITLLFGSLQHGGFSYLGAAALTGAIVMVISTTAASLTEETFGKDLDFLES